MSKFLQAFLSGIFFTFILDFFLFLGIQQNYIDFYEIDLYYNILFADNQNIYIFLILSALLGFLITYLNIPKVAFFTISLLFLLTFSTLIPSVGYMVGEKLFKKRDVTLMDKKYTYKGDIYYDAREQIIFYDYELGKIILLNKKELIK